MKEVYTVIKVVSSSDRRRFLDMVEDIYRDYPNWIRPLNSDIEAVFDPSRNELLADGEACRWIVTDSANKVVGRIAAFYNPQQAAVEQQPTGGCGFFESVDSMDVATLLFDTAKDWLQERGMEAMDGPINFGDRSNWWGLLIQGFEHTPLYCNNYNPPYYQHLFEEYGFCNYFNQHTYLRPLTVGTFGEYVYERINRLKSEPGYRFESVNTRRLGDYAEQFRTIYNKAWAKFTGVKPIDSYHAQKLMRTMKPIVDGDLMYFAYHNDEPIGFFIMIPDLNRIIYKFKGRFGIIEKLRLILTLKTCSVDRAAGIIFGVVPEYQGKSIESGMMYEFERTLDRKNLPYKTMEMSWIGDFNPVMMRVCERYVGAFRHKMHTTYRYLFDRTKEFSRCPSLRIPRPTKSE